MPGVLTKSKSYAERLFHYQTLANLTREQTDEVFMQTAAKNGRTFTTDALGVLWEQTKGYPYFIQAYGAAALGKTTTQISNTRQILMAHGLIYSPSFGRAAFTVPGMGDFIRRHEPTTEFPHAE